jgi:outer membrane protein OmpA-like peptidoglycan-associated protein
MDMLNSSCKHRGPGRPRVWALGVLLAQAAVSAGAATGPQIPLCVGTTIVTAISQPDGDYESIKRIESVSPDRIRLKFSADVMVTDELSDEPPKLVQQTMYRTMLTRDLSTARLYEQQFYDELPEVIPGTTAIGTSTTVLEELKTQGHSNMGIFIGFSGEPSMDPGDMFYLYNNKMEAPVERVEPGAVLLPVIVNGVPTQLPAIHARGDFQGDKSEFYFLDDVSNPLTLKFRIGIDALVHVETHNGKDEIVAGGAEGKNDRAVLQVIKISSRCAVATNHDAPDEVEQSLEKTGKAVVYDIYFSFNSANLRPESEPALREIATALQRHPDWKLGVGGHTDNIGGQAYNLKLSQQRAAAVNGALVSRYHIDAQRLSASGYGASQPQDTNATLAGRARNRRVELVKQ